MELIQAVRKNDIASIEHMIEKGANVNYKYEDPEVTFNGYSPLHFCVFHKYLSAAQLLLNNGADPEVTDERGNTPFLTAVLLYSFDILNLLVQKGAHVHAVNHRGHNAFDLILEAWHGEDHMEDKKNINEGERVALKRLFDRTEVIIKNGYDLNAGNTAAFSALIQIKGHGVPVQVLTWLFENGANPREIVEETQSPLLVEVVSRKLPVDAIAAMINKIGLEHVFESFHNLTPVMIAAGYHNIPLIQKLIEAGANIHSQNERALRTAVMNGQLDMVKYLVEAGASIQVIDNDGKSLLWYAEQNGYHEIIDYLTQKGSRR